MRLFALNKKVTIVFAIVALVILAFGAFAARQSGAGALIQKGNYYFNVKGVGKYDLDKAAKYFNKALEADPNVPDARHQLARIDFLRGNFDGALIL